MDSELDALEYNRMDHSAVNVQFVDDFLEFLARIGKRLRKPDDPTFEELDEESDIVASLIDVGTGTAQIPIELCKRNRDIRVMAIDLAASMLDLAVRNVDIAGLREPIQLAQADAKDTQYDDEMFDGLISNSIIHHIPEPEESLEEMFRLTRRGGTIFVRDLLRPESAAEVNRLVNTYAAEESDYSRRLFTDSLHAALSLKEIREFVSDMGGELNEVVATSDRHWTWTAIR
jgi:ubiquinone/menaquinone biosynthesis C-methylase UbiE